MMKYILEQCLPLLVFSRIITIVFDSFLKKVQCVVGESAYAKASLSEFAIVITIPAVLQDLQCVDTRIGDSECPPSSL